ncbi:transaldolase [Anaeramoeba flamelloides]|uniref:Transaldolase n=1 Tax=Anaeramoeba flamelloides TaxID=1746091 RepID=A0AAV7YTZ1_9EUKA|nr:transaldolase [Anaeramoeba flamelloides]KAJ6231982.1 transaldolase [Anaeramoeba flamelloides]|eukprot:Anaeramoba_flamelloidesa808863_257.p1 GENE.a808863_257~~a808863_257.p1  ORF type:complete len:342 (-),score=83.57 a808863_257:207-1187(-)
MTTGLEKLKEFTTVVADTGDFESIAEFSPQDCTTNPTLILRAFKLTKYSQLVKDCVNKVKEGYKGDKESLVTECLDNIFVTFGKAILELLPKNGRVSTELDPRLSFDTEGSILRARKLIALYEKAGVPRDRVLIKIASTWEGIQAAKILETEGIHCNLTLLFSFGQAVACADAKVTLISPFVGRIRDWHLKFNNPDKIEDFEPSQDPGVISVASIYNYYKKFGIKTEIMGASFRNIGEITELVGCDLLTIAPRLLKELKQMKPELIVKKLDQEKAKEMDIEECEFDEKKFRWELCCNQMASEKLFEGIRHFKIDYLVLQGLIAELL